ncbi:MAG: hypothetical protein NT126_07460 [Bacteroidetes bacterium]|nr:hypothetical protein [Bacteroidota bacterium]
MDQLEIFYNKLYDNKESKDPKTFIKLFEENKELIESTDASTSNPDFSGILRLISDYAISLSNYGSTTKAIPYLDKAIKLFHDFSTFKNEDLNKIPIYETLVWRRGVDNYHLKKYSLATTDFQYLVENFPDNDVYRNWLLASRTIKAKKYLNILWPAGFICLMWETMVNKEDAKLKDYLLIAMIVIFVLAIAVEIINSLVKDSIKKK